MLLPLLVLALGTNSAAGAAPLQPAAAAKLMVQAVMANTNVTGCVNGESPARCHSCPCQPLAAPADVAGGVGHSKDPRCLFGRWAYGNSIILDSMLCNCSRNPPPPLVHLGDPF